MIKKLHQMGLRSGHMYTAGAVSIGLSFASWLMSNSLEAKGIDRADRWGIFIGEWAPTFVALGVALRMEETHHDLEESEMKMYDKAERRRADAHAKV
ncbi:hypothetical protein [Nonomuraea jiangxiensis]|uniref:Uncharacterized protein n=1 Tax=Nonomuraea jiangxiensis TaxID=633440 RepID=A0A1G9U861_9ACTN|nr:hypothetical protein [Nonomuraea jiangxiensis]SDM56140.1 hypothetical protein SAMN05421869_14743 [Nonomuraea jiangxiensis]